MRCVPNLWTGCVLLTMVFGCVSQTQYETVENNYRRVSQQIAQKDTELEIIRNSLHKSEKEQEKCNDDLNTLHVRIEHAQKENRALLKKIADLNQALVTQDKVIGLQEAVIRLFDDTDQTIETSLKEQIDALPNDADAASQTLKIVLVDNLLFPSGSAALSPEGKTLLSTLGGLLQEEKYHAIRVEGHTDDRPIKSSNSYQSNWDLSAARATTVVRFLHESVGVAPERMSATGFGPYRPVAANDTAEGRRQNRRIEIILEPLQ